jgi:hypothetical protein
MNDVREEQLKQLKLLEEALMNQIQAIKKCTTLLWVEVNNEEAWKGTHREIEEHKLEVLGHLSRLHNELNTLTHPLMSLRSSVTVRYVPEEGEDDHYKDGYNSGMYWRDHWNHRPGGPFTYQKDEKAYNEQVANENRLHNLKERHKVEQWFRGFDDALLHKMDLGIFVPEKAKPKKR